MRVTPCACRPTSRRPFATSHAAGGERLGRLAEPPGLEDSHGEDRQNILVPALAGGTDDLQNLASTTDVTAPGWKPPDPDDGPRPLGDLDYIATDAGYTIIDDIPRRRGIAPAHILIPQLGDRLWHQWPNVEPRDGAPKQFFDLVACTGPP